LVKAHSGPALSDYRGVYVWQMEQAIVISTPAAVESQTRAAVAGHSAVTLLDAAFWRGALGERVERVVGPSYQGFVDAGAFRRTPTRGARPLTPADGPALERFIAACPPGDWDDSAISRGDPLIFGLELAGSLIALASAPEDGALRSVGVVTLPAARGMGAGRAVVGALTADAVAGGAILRYQTLRGNHASVAIARALGYEDVATALAIRLKS
jgi:GNAT superfamily N-acetyltransferase